MTAAQVVAVSGKGLGAAGNRPKYIISINLLAGVDLLNLS